MSNGWHWAVRLAWLLLVATLLSVSLALWIPAGDEELTRRLQLLGYAGLLGVLGLFGTCVLGLPLGLVFLRTGLRRKWPEKRTDLLTATVFALPLLFFPPLLVAVATIPTTENKVRARSFRALAESSQPLVDAIARYHRHQDFPPSSLTALVPEYLDEIPGTGMGPYPEYRYLVFEEGFPGCRMHYYDLGRHGRVVDALDDWNYTEFGRLDHAYLIVVSDLGGVVRYVDTDRIPGRPRDRPFEAETWRRSERRLDMLADLRSTHELVGMQLEDLVALLGEPDGFGAFHRSGWGTPWELRVPCGRGFANWDVFVYWPSEEYPSAMYGGTVERMGRWAYVHE